MAKKQETGRRTGRTTRVIDKAIQTFFEEGQIIVPYSTTDTKGFKKAQIITDPDLERVGETVQRHLLGKIIRRLTMEHRRDSFIQEGLILKLPPSGDDLLDTNE
jgi:hypothetical protein